MSDYMCLRLLKLQRDLSQGCGNKSLCRVRKVFISAFLFKRHSFQNQRVYDCFMVIFDMELLYFPTVHCTFLAQEIYGIAFLQDGIALILLVIKHVLQCGGLSYGFSVQILDALALKSALDVIHCLSRKAFIVKPYYYFACSLFTTKCPLLFISYPWNRYVLIPNFLFSNLLRMPHVEFSEIDLDLS